jgi:mono/diheme cytochrome c family protein
LGSLFFLWYYKSLPDAAKEMADMTPLIPKIIPHIVIGSLIVLMIWFIFTLIKPDWARLVPGIVAIMVLLGGIFSAESMRERIRKPYVIDHYMYSNQIISNDMPAKQVKSNIADINTQGILHYSYFVPENLRDVNNQNMLQAGRIIAQIECSACHTLQANGWLRPLPKMVKKAGLGNVDDAQAFIGFLNAFPFMPPFAGTDMEKKALAVYLASLYK